MLYSCIICMGGVLYLGMYEKQALCRSNAEYNILKANHTGPPSKDFRGFGEPAQTPVHPSLPEASAKACENRRIHIFEPALSSKLREIHDSHRPQDRCGRRGGKGPESAS